MDKSQRMKVLYGRADLPQVAAGSIQAKSLTQGMLLSQRPIRRVFHHEIVEALSFPIIKGLHNMRMIHLHQIVSFFGESLRSKLSFSLIGYLIREEYFYSDLSFEVRMRGPADINTLSPAKQCKNVIIIKPEFFVTHHLCS